MILFYAGAFPACSLECEGIQKVSICVSFYHTKKQSFLTNGGGKAHEYNHFTPLLLAIEGCRESSDGCSHDHEITVYSVEFMDMSQE